MLGKKDKILIAGASGMVGSALVRAFKKAEYFCLLTPSRQELDYIEQGAVRHYLECHKPDIIVIAAAKVGGIWANLTYPAEFMYENLMIASHLIHEAHKIGISRILFLGSSCIYPKQTAQPISETSLLTGSLESTNEAYALAKIAGVKLCQYYRKQYGRSYISAMPTNLYGPNDNYHPENSHVVPALIRRCHEAKSNYAPQLSIWGSGNVYREFLYVDDVASACLHLLEYYDCSEPINIGSDEELTIRELAHKIVEVIEYSGKLTYDLSKPDGIFRKKTDSSRMFSLGWKPVVSLEEGLQRSYSDFCARYIVNSNSISA